ncbi:hypothetical protein MHBO_002815, partial [Bonamia ostreae]
MSGKDKTEEENLKEIEAKRLFKMIPVTRLLPYFSTTEILNLSQLSKKWKKQASTHFNKVRYLDLSEFWVLLGNIDISLFVPFCEKFESVQILNFSYCNYLTDNDFLT